MIKLQQLSSYLVLRRLEHSLAGRLAWRSQAPGAGREFPAASPTRSTLAPPRPAPCKSPGSLICIHPAHLHIPQLWVAPLPRGWLTAAPFVFTCHPGTCSFSLRIGEERRARETKREGRRTLKTKRQAPSGQQEENASVWSSDPGGSRRRRDRPRGWLESGILALPELARGPASSFPWLWHPGQVTLRLMPLFPHLGNGPSHWRVVVAWCVATPSSGLCICSWAGRGLMYQLVALPGTHPTSGCPSLFLHLSFLQVVGPPRTGSLESSPSSAVQRLGANAHMCGDDDDNIHINSVCSENPALDRPGPGFSRFILQSSWWPRFYYDLPFIEDTKAPTEPQPILSACFREASS